MEYVRKPITNTGDSSHINKTWKLYRNSSTLKEQTFYRTINLILDTIQIISKV